MNAIILILCIIPLARGHDLAIGLNNYGTKIFDESRQASPAIWRQKENVTIEAAENEVITKVIIIDMRPEKDGDARIVDGGEGLKSVTIELKSPTVFRGYDFHLFVYSAPENQTYRGKSSSDGSPTTSPDFMLHTNAVNTEAPIITTMNPALKDVSGNNRRARTASEINSAGSMTSSGSDTFMNSPLNSAFSSAVSNASTNSSDLTSGSAVSIASVTSTADSSSGSSVSDATTNSSATSNVASDISNPSPFSTGGTGLSDSDATMTSQSVPGSIGNDMNTITPNTSEENIISTTEPISVTTILPDMNIPNGNYFSDVNLMNNDGMRHVRKIEEENITTDGSAIETTEMTTMADILNENSTETISGIIDGISNKDTRHSRGITDTGTENYYSESTTEPNVSEMSTSLPTTLITEMTGNGNTQVTTANIIENDVRLTRGTNIENSDNINETSTVLYEEITTDVSSGDDEDTSDIPDIGNSNEVTSSTSIPNENAGLDPVPDVTIAETEESNLNPTVVANNNEYSQLPQDMPPSLIDQMLRNPRDAAKIGSSIFGDNSFNDPSKPNGSNSSIYPIFVDPSQVEAGEQSNSSEYVYVPVIALISKSSYPLFEEALQHLPGQTQVNSNTTLINN